MGKTRGGKTTVLVKKMSIFALGNQFIRFIRRAYCGESAVPLEKFHHMPCHVPPLRFVEIPVQSAWVGTGMGYEDA